MTTGTLQIHSENLLPIIKRWLYSDKDIFVRELVSNACDAIRKLKVLRERGEAEIVDSEFRIDITIDKEAKILSFKDTGIGMDVEEVKKYIAQLAFSGAEEFLKKYENNNENEQIIGHFGMGFYSAYMVAGLVEIQTLSYKKEAEPVLWVSEGTSEYTIDKGTRSTRGTEIILHVDQESEEYLDAVNIRKILDKYSSFLPYPIYLNGEHVNTKEPLWTRAIGDCKDEDYKAFYKQLYPFEEEPLFWVHINVDYPFHLRGILYFPKLRRDFDFSKNNIKLFCNRVFVSDDCKDLIPDYLTMLRGAIDSPDIPLNVSRSYLQMDRTVRQLGQHISKKVSDKLIALHRDDREHFLKCWKDIEVIIKLGAIQDDKFYERVKEVLVWQNLDGEWTSITEYQERHQEKYNNKIYYTTGDSENHFLEMFRNKGVEVLKMNPTIDTHVMGFVEGKMAPVRFQRVDAGLDDHLLDKEREKSILDAEGKTEAARLADFVRRKVKNDKLEIQAKSLPSDALPCFVMIDEHGRRLRDYMRTSDQENASKLEALEKRTLVVNTNSPLITAIWKLDATDPDLSTELLSEVMDLSLLSQRELQAKELDGFIKRTSNLLEKLTRKAK